MDNEAVEARAGEDQTGQMSHKTALLWDGHAWKKGMVF